MAGRRFIIRANFFGGFYAPPNHRAKGPRENPQCLDLLAQNKCNNAFFPANVVVFIREKKGHSRK